VRRTAETPLQVLILTNVPIPIPVDQLTTWNDLCTSGPFEMLVARGVVPLDYAGIAAALPARFANAARVKDWFPYRPDARSTFKSILNLARALGYVVMSDFSGILHSDSIMDDSAKLIAYRYGRDASRQRAVVLIDIALHANPRAAAEAVIGAIDHLSRIESASPRRRRQRKTSMDVVSQSVLDQLLSGSRDTAGLRSFGSTSEH
jgi:hypothetical protein